MNVFEKILERLDEPKFDISCGECPYREKCDEVQETITNEKTDLCSETMRAIAKEIVQEVAEEFAPDTNVGTNGWIPCSERLPEEHTVLCCDKYGEMIVGHPYFDEVSNTNYSAESDNEMMYSCVAWQPLQEPYKEIED
ncbi:MAG: DUF551 domain-containing protein [Sphaerochaetaceae bacterium]|nr:DUF551 domain-containing protein [Sphaerochaetaceae bacterium]